MKKLFVIVFFLLFIFPLTYADSLMNEHLPETSSFFDYDDLVLNPSAHENRRVFLIGKMTGIKATEVNINGFLQPAQAILSVDGDAGKLVYVYFDMARVRGDISDNCTVYLTGVTVGGNINYPSPIGFYICMPLYMAATVEVI